MRRDDKISNIVTTSLVLLFAPALIPVAIVAAAFLALSMATTSKEEERQA